MKWSVPKMIVTELNGVDLTKYRNHPRILELRLAMLHKLMAEEYSAEIAVKFLHSLCDLFRCNWNVINQIINNVYNIRQMSKDSKKRWRQELVFMGMTLNETRYAIAKRYLDLNISNSYRKEYNLTPSNFLTQEWVDELDASVVVCGLSAYRFEAERFMQEYDNMLEVMGRVLTSKVRNK